MACQQEHSAFETCPECGFDAFVRNHYFTGKMMGAAEFATETLYHSDKMRHHNLRLHGTGTVCGLRVHQHPSPDCRRRYVVVETGSALDCCGHEILVAQPEIVDVAGNAEVQRLTADALLHALQLCVRFRDCPTEDVPVLYDECGCDDTQCAPNRILESFAIDVRIDPPLPPLAATDLQAQGALVATDLHGVTGFLRADAAGRVALIDPAEANRLVIIDTARRSRRSVALGRAARALALSPDGAHVFVATDSSNATAEAEVRVFVTEDASEVGPVGAGVLRKLTGTTAASVVRLSTSMNPARTLLAHVRSSGDLLAFAADATTHVITDAPAAAIASAPNLDAFTAASDGSEAYAIDAGAAPPVMRLIDFSGAAPTSLAGLPAGAQPVALAAFGFQGAPQLAIASGADRRVYLVDRTSNAVTSIDLQHPPEALGAIGDPATAGVWLHVLERESNAWYAQAIALAPIAAAPPQPPLTGAARSVGSGARQIVLVGSHAGATSGGGGAQAVLDFAALAEGDCGDHVWHQLDGCPACDTGDCVVLATIPNYRSNAELLDLPAAADDLVQRRARIDNRLGRRMLASTASLQAWLECLQMQGGVAGPVGKDGIDGTGIDAVQATFVPCEQPGSAALQVIAGVSTLVLQIPRGCDGDDGLGIDAVQATFVPCNVPGAAALQVIAGVRTLVLTIPRGCDGQGLEEDLVRIAEIGWKHDEANNKLSPARLLGEAGGDFSGLWVRFDKPVRALDQGSITFTPHVFTVQLPQGVMAPHDNIDERNATLRRAPDRLCWCDAIGIVVPAKVDGNGQIEEVADIPSDVWAFVFSPRSVDVANRMGHLRLLLRGDFFIDEQGRAVDAEFPRARLPSGDHPESVTYGIQGGVFESWLWLGDALGRQG